MGIRVLHIFLLCLVGPDAHFKLVWGEVLEGLMFIILTPEEYLHAVRRATHPIRDYYLVNAYLPL